MVFGPAVGAGLVWAIGALTILLILIRPRRWPEAVWACAGAILLLALRLISPGRAGVAVARGTDVYLFLAGMMLLAEIARREGVFDWLAVLAVQAARGSRLRLFGLVYATGIVVTVFLSNDATAVVLTPAVYAAVRQADADPLPDLFACAFIANAASFVLPISNPANLVVYGGNPPSLFPWLRIFLLPSAVAIIVTFAALRFLWRGSLRGDMKQVDVRGRLTRSGRYAACALAIAAVLLIATSALGWRLGLPTLLIALASLAATGDRRGFLQILRGVSWTVLPMVAGLFVIVEALNAAGTLRDVTSALRAAASLGPVGSLLSASFGIALLSNVMNNLPSGLLAGSALAAAPFASGVHRAILIGVDLGPNLSVTGSLATILWLTALRRDGLEVSSWQFCRQGLLVMPPALLLSTLALLLTGC